MAAVTFSHSSLELLENDSWANPVEAQEYPRAFIAHMRPAFDRPARLAARVRGVDRDRQAVRPQSLLAVPLADLLHEEGDVLDAPGGRVHKLPCSRVADP